jgi:hypothetical protein
VLVTTDNLLRTICANFFWSLHVQNLTELQKSLLGGPEARHREASDQGAGWWGGGIRVQSSVTAQRQCFQNHIVCLT